jgi:HSP20 family molecular chaperone IbpA
VAAVRPVRELRRPVRADGPADAQPEPAARPSSWSAPVDIEETEDAYVVEVDLPGVSRQDVTVDWNRRQLTLHGEVKERERTGLLRRQNRRTGRFDYTVTLPARSTPTGSRRRWPTAS